MTQANPEMKPPFLGTPLGMNQDSPLPLASDDGGLLLVAGPACRGFAPRER